MVASRVPKGTQSHTPPAPPSPNPHPPARGPKRRDIHVYPCFNLRTAMVGLRPLLESKGGPPRAGIARLESFILGLGNTAVQAVAVVRSFSVLRYIVRSEQGGTTQCSSRYVATHTHMPGALLRLAIAATLPYTPDCFLRGTGYLRALF